MIDRPLAILLGTLTCSLAAAQSIDERVRDLERRVEQLERVGKQPAGAAEASRPTARSDRSRQLENWRALRLDMTEADVRTILGEPHKVEVIGFITWYYQGNGDVRFDRRNGKVVGWSEPGR